MQGSYKMPKGTDESLEDAVATVVADLPSVVADTPSTKTEDSDAKADLYVRKIIDGVTKSIADLLKPTAAPVEDDEPEVKRKRTPKAVVPVVKKRSFTLFG